MPTKLLHLVRHGHSVQNHTMETIGARLIGADPDTIEMRSLMGVFPEVLEEMKTLTLERDSPLTPKGQQQAESLKGRASFLQPPHVELVVASTQRRALLTASIVNGEAIAAGELRAVSLASNGGAWRMARRIRLRLSPSGSCGEGMSSLKDVSLTDCARHVRLRISNGQKQGGRRMTWASWHRHRRQRATGTDASASRHRQC